MKKKIRSILIICIWIALWQFAAAAIRNPIIFVGPWKTLQALVSQIFNLDFWQTVFSSLSRISLGFSSAFCLGILLGAAAGHFSLFRDFLEPAIGLLQSVPVASFVILALIWIGSENLSVLITFLVVFPVIYRNVLEGIHQVDHQLLEMARIFRLGPWKRLLYLYRPALMPYLLTGCRISLGMAWKSGVAAEVIGVPAHSIGEKLYMAKIYLSTAELFAWTFVIILVSRLFEKAFLWFLKQLSTDLKEKPDGKDSQNLSLRSVSARTPGTGRKKTPVKKCALHSETDTEKSPGIPSPIRILHLGKSYQNHPVLSDLSLTLEPGKIYCLMGPSGCGKTTLLRLIMGLETPDAGKITGLDHQRISAVFQEDRLFYFLNPVKNVRLTCAKSTGSSLPEELLEQILEPEALTRPVSRLSGGMKRRTAIVRALCAPSDLVIMDEPFTGLDEDTRNRVIQLIRNCLGKRTLLLVTHQEEDAEKLKGKIIKLM